MQGWGVRHRTTVWSVKTNNLKHMTRHMCTGDHTQANRREGTGDGWQHMSTAHPQAGMTLTVMLYEAV